LYGLMQNTPLSLSWMFSRAEDLYADQEIVTGGPRPSRYTYGEWAGRTRRLVAALDRLRVPEYGKVATFAWNTADHLSAYFAAPCSRRVLHTLNIRLAAKELAYVIGHAEDDVVIVDAELLDRLVEPLAQARTVRHVVVVGGAEALPDVPGCAVHDLDDLLDGETPAELRDPDDERRAAAICYTSGTTGRPKGVVYSHRSMILHCYGVQLANSLGISDADRVCPIVPMFHANAWGLPHAAVAAGAALVLPGSDTSADALSELLERERVTVASAVPTVWASLLDALDGRDLSSMRLMNAGGSAVSRLLSDSYQTVVRQPLVQGWGMTEMSPIGAVARASTPVEAAALPVGSSSPGALSVGRPLMGVEVRIISPDDGATALPWNGEAVGELQVRGPWIASGYLDIDASDGPLTADGWLRTGDLARLDRHGFIYIVDRTKDLIKSGGEWISSSALEEAIRAHPEVVDAAVIGVPDPRWQERPIAYVTVRTDPGPGVDELRAFLSRDLPTWWAPDQVEILEEIPRTSVGKTDKQGLRARWDRERSRQSNA
jgi:fatty-acyl-CoA synthase